MLRATGQLAASRAAASLSGLGSAVRSFIIVPGSGDAVGTEVVVEFGVAAPATSSNSQALPAPPINGPDIGGATRESDLIASMTAALRAQLHSSDSASRSATGNRHGGNVNADPSAALTSIAPPSDAAARPPQRNHSVAFGVRGTSVDVRRKPSRGGRFGTTKLSASNDEAEWSGSSLDDDHVPRRPGQRGRLLTRISEQDHKTCASGAGDAAVSYESSVSGASDDMVTVAADASVSLERPPLSIVVTSEGSPTLGPAASQCSRSVHSGERSGRDSSDSWEDDERRVLAELLGRS